MVKEKRGWIGRVGAALGRLLAFLSPVIPTEEAAPIAASEWRDRQEPNARKPTPSPANRARLKDDRLSAVAQRL